LYAGVDVRLSVFKVFDGSQEVRTDDALQWILFRNGCELVLFFSGYGLKSSTTASLMSSNISKPE
jgi:hypothetical protein